MEVPYVAHAVPVMASQGHCQLKETVLKTLPLNARFRTCMELSIPLRTRKSLAGDMSLLPGGEISALPVSS